MEEAAQNEEPESSSDFDGTYKLWGEIATGSRSVIYHAEQQRLGKEVAIKVLRDRLPNDALLREEWNDEIRRFAALDHPNLVTINGFGIVGDAPYIAMELLEGETLAERLAAGPLEPEQAEELIASMLRALAHLHVRGVVHRNLTPSSVFLQKNVEGGLRVKLIDYGMVHLPANQNAGPEQAAARAAAAPYLAPELQTGDEPDARSDVFAAGKIINEILAGAPAQGAPDETAARVNDLQPTAAASSAFNVFMSRAIDKDKTERYRNGDQMLRVLMEFPTPWLERTIVEIEEEASPDDVVRQDGTSEFPLLVEPEPEPYVSPPPPVLPRRRRGASRKLMAAGALVALAAAGWTLAEFLRAPAQVAQLPNVAAAGNVAQAAAGAQAQAAGAAPAPLADTQGATPAVPAPGGSAAPSFQEPTAAPTTPSEHSAPLAAAPTPDNAAPPIKAPPEAPAAPSREQLSAPALAAPEQPQPSAAGEHPTERSATAATWPTYPSPLARAPQIASDVQPPLAADQPPPEPVHTWFIQPPLAADDEPRAPEPPPAAEPEAPEVERDWPPSPAKLAALAAKTRDWPPPLTKEPEPVAQPPAQSADPAANPPEPSAPTPPPAAKVDGSVRYVKPLSNDFRELLRLVGAADPPRGLPADPWTGPLPKELEMLRDAIAKGEPGTAHEIAILRRFCRHNPEDAHGHLLLAGLYGNRGWRLDALDQYELAFRKDPTSRGAPEMLKDVLRMVTEGVADGDAARFLARSYQREALPAIGAALRDKTLKPAASARLKQLRARIVAGAR